MKEEIDISRVNVYPPIKNNCWKYFLSDWQTNGEITIIEIYQKKLLKIG